MEEVAYAANRRKTAGGADRARTSGGADCGRERDEGEEPFGRERRERPFRVIPPIWRYRSVLHMGRIFPCGNECVPFHLCTKH